MKEIKQMKEVITGYEAGDGTLFDSKEECKKYEESAVYAIKKQFYDMAGDVRCVDTYLCGDDCIYLVDLSSPERLTLANMWMKTQGSNDRFTDDMIGKKIAVNTGYDGDFAYIMGTREQVIAKLMRCVVYPIFGEEENA